MVQNDVLDTAKREGRAEGRVEGRAEGILLAARNLKSMGFSVADIMKATGLSEGDIMSL